MRYLKAALVLWAPFAVLFVAVAAPAAAQSSLAEVKCSFFDDYVESGYERSAGMPLAIAVAGDELPTEVATAFSALEDGDPVTESHRIAIVNFFDPACDDAALTTTVSNPATPGSAGVINPASSGAQPPEQLASTGADMTTALIATFGIALLAGGVWVLQLDPTTGVLGAGSAGAFWNVSRTEPEEVKSLPVAVANTHRFWLLDDDGK